MKLYIMLLNTISLMMFTSLPLIKFIFKMIAMFTYLFLPYFYFLFLLFCIHEKTHVFSNFFLFKSHPEYLNFLIKLWLFIECSFF